MNAPLMVHDWRKLVRNQLLPELHGHQANALAELSFAMTLATHCHSGRIAVCAAGPARPASVTRRIERLLANDRLDPQRAYAQLAHAVLASWAGAPIVLILDETPSHNHLRCLKLTLAYRRRAVPLWSVCYALGRSPGPLPKLIERLFRQAAASLPKGAEVTLLADRGLAWPQVIAACRRRGWHYVLRLQSSTRVRPANGPETSVAALAPGPGTSWWGPAQVFKKSGWHEANVAACWEAGAEGPWLLVSDRNAGPRLFRRYARRSWTEELFRDEKSSGFHWDESHVRDPEHAARLVLVMALATYLALGLGSRVIQAGLRRFLESGRRRTLSLFQIGLRWLKFCVVQSRPLPGKLSPVPP